MKRTLTIDCLEKTFNYKGKSYLIRLWDTAGQEKYSYLTKSYYNKAHGIILCCALDNRISFDNLNKWLKSLIENSYQKYEMIILGNKLDLDEKIVKEWELEEKSIEKNCKYFLTSALTSENIFSSIDYLILQIIEKAPKTSGFGFFSLGGGENNDKKGYKCSDSC